jgi:hypothetical protein
MPTETLFDGYANWCEFYPMVGPTFYCCGGCYQRSMSSAAPAAQMKFPVVAPVDVRCVSCGKESPRG